MQKKEPNISFHSQVLSNCMSLLPSSARAYSLQDALRLGEKCRALFLDARLHETVPAAVWDLKNLEVLNLRGIALPIIPEKIGQFNQLKILDVSGCDEEQVVLPNIHLKLEGLFISNSQLNTIPDWILNIDSLRCLFLKDCRVNNIPKTIHNLSLLEEFNLKNNNIKNIPSSLFSLNRLKKLFLPQNKISFLDEEVKKLVALRELDLSQNKIQSLPQPLGSLGRLEKLDVSHNKIQSLPDFIGKCHSLSKLFLSNNQIEKLPDSIVNCPISHLDISNNSLIELPKEFHSTPRLKELNLSNNKIKKLPPLFEQLKNLQHITFKKNIFEGFPFPILGLKKIKKINGLKIKSNINTNIKPLLPFILSCNKYDIPFEQRILWWTIFSNIEEESRTNISSLLDCPYLPFRKSAISTLTKESEKTSLKNSSFFILGKVQKNKIYQLFLENNFRFDTSFTEETTHIVLGQGRIKIPSNFKGIFLRQEQFLSLFEKPETHNFTWKKLETIEKIKLLLQGNKQKKELGLLLLQDKELPSSLHIPLLVIMYTEPLKSLRDKARKLLEKRIPSNYLKLSKKDFNSNEHQIYNLFERLEMQGEKPLELCQEIFNTTQKGWSYLYKKHHKNVFKSLVKNNYLDLSRADLEQIPEEMLLLNEVTKINLSHNKIKKIRPEYLLLLRQMSEINLSKNPIQKIPVDFFAFKNLRFLHLKNCDKLIIHKKEWQEKAPWVTLFI